MQKNRTIAIILNDESALPCVRETVSVLVSAAVCAEISVFSKNELPEFNTDDGRVRCVSRKFPRCPREDMNAAVRNAILKDYEQSGFAGVLHVISDSVQLLKDPGPFMDDLEAMMRVLDYPVWLSTVSDPCNYVYSKYNPQLTLTNDMPELAKIGIKCDISFTSHSNTAWMAYDIAALRSQEEIKYFSEDFQIAMFYIIEFLARRRANRKNGQLFFMNQYMTVGSELGVYRIQEQRSSDEKQIGPETMHAEDLLFKKMNVNYAPDRNIDTVINSFIEKIAQKAEIPGMFV